MFIYKNFLYHLKLVIIIHTLLFPLWDAAVHLWGHTHLNGLTLLASVDNVTLGLWCGQLIGRVRLCIHSDQPGPFMDWLVVATWSWLLWLWHPPQFIIKTDSSANRAFSLYLLHGFASVDGSFSEVGSFFGERKIGPSVSLCPSPTFSSQLRHREGLFSLAAPLAAT